MNTNFAHFKVIHDNETAAPQVYTIQLKSVQQQRSNSFRSFSIAHLSGIINFLVEADKTLFSLCVRILHIGFLDTLRLHFSYALSYQSHHYFVGHPLPPQTRTSFLNDPIKHSEVLD